MFHYATISTGEVTLLRTITKVIRMGRVQATERDALLLDQGRAAMDPATLYLDCTASAVEPREIHIRAVFQGKRIVINLLRAPAGGAERRDHGLCRSARRGRCAQEPVVPARTLFRATWPVMRAPPR